MSLLDVARLPAALRRLVETELRPGERIVWMDQPLPGRLARSTWPLVAFGIPWTAFAVFWTAMAATATAKGASGWFHLFPLFGLPFILIGCGLLGSPWWARRKALGTVYLITDQRAILLEGGWRGGVTVRSFRPDQLGTLERLQRPDGTGDIILERHRWRDSDGDRRTSRTGFLAIREVKAVGDLLQQLARSRAGSPTE